MNKLIISLLLFFNSVITFSQSLKKDTVLLNKLLNRGNYLLSSNLDSGLIISQNCIALALKIKEKKFVNQSYNLHGQVNYRLGNLDVALESFRKQEKFASKLSEKSYPKQHPRYNEIIEKLQEFHDARGLKKLEKSERELLTRQIEEWVEANLPEITDKILDWEEERIETHRDEMIADFWDYEVGEIVPRSLELDDEEGLEEFYVVLEDELYKNFKPRLDRILGYNFPVSLAWEITSEIPNPIEYLSTHTPEEVLDYLYEADPEGLYEILREEFSNSFHEQIFDFATSFAFDYQP
jgi:hypothetical protein